MNVSEVILVFCTFPDQGSARQVGTYLVDAQLAACVNLVPGIESIYRWQGTVHSAQEVLCLFKTTTQALPTFQQVLAEHHPYDTPEILTVSPESVSDRYAEWVRQAVHV